MKKVIKKIGFSIEISYAVMLKCIAIFVNFIWKR